MPKFEIFDLLDSCDLYNIKSFWVGNFSGTLIKHYFLQLAQIIAILLAKNFISIWADLGQKKLVSDCFVFDLNVLKYLFFIFHFLKD